MVSVTLLLLLGNLHVGFVNASTPENGIIKTDTSWTRGNSPYSLTGPVAINSGATLTIEPGATIYLNNYYIQVNGTLIAKGTATDPIKFAGGSITFTALSKNWDEQTGSGSIIQYANFTQVTDQYGNFLNSAVVTIDDSSPKIVENSQVSITVNGGSPIISHNTGNGNLEIYGGNAQVTNNEIWALDISGASPLIASNVIGYGLYLNPFYNLEYPGGSPIIWNNSITFPGQDGPSAVVTLASNGMPIVSNNNITGLVEPITHDQFGRTGGGQTTAYGILIDGNAFISNNIISGGKTAEIMVSTSNFEGTANVTIQNNTVSSSGIAISSLVKATINFNNIQGGLTLSQKASNDVNASYNWWGTADQSAIDQSIHDFKDDFTLGKVTFTPFLAGQNKEAVPDANASIPTPSIATLPSTPQQTSSTSNVPTEMPQNSKSPRADDKTATALIIDWKSIAIIVLAVIVAGLTVAIAVMYRKIEKLIPKP